MQIFMVTSYTINNLQVTTCDSRPDNHFSFSLFDSDSTGPICRPRSTTSWSPRFSTTNKRWAISIRSWRHRPISSTSAANRCRNVADVSFTCFFASLIRMKFSCRFRRTECLWKVCSWALDKRSIRSSTNDADDLLNRFLFWTSRRPISSLCQSNRSFSRINIEPFETRNEVRSRFVFNRTAKRQKKTNELGSADSFVSSIKRKDWSDGQPYRPDATLTEDRGSTGRVPERTNNWLERFCPSNEEKTEGKVSFDERFLSNEWSNNELGLRERLCSSNQSWNWFVGLENEWKRWASCPTSSLPRTKTRSARTDDVRLSLVDEPRRHSDRWSSSDTFGWSSWPRWSDESKHCTSVQTKDIRDEELSIWTIPLRCTNHEEYPIGLATKTVKSTEKQQETRNIDWSSLTIVVWFWPQKCSAECHIERVEQIARCWSLDRRDRFRSNFHCSLIASTWQLKHRTSTRCFFEAAIVSLNFSDNFSVRERVIRMKGLSLSSYFDFRSKISVGDKQNEKIFPTSRTERPTVQIGIVVLEVLPSLIPLRVFVESDRLRFTEIGKDKTIVRRLKCFSAWKQTCPERRFSLSSRRSFHFVCEELPVDGNPKAESIWLHRQFPRST